MLSLTLREPVCYSCQPVGLQNFTTGLRNFKEKGSIGMYSIYHCQVTLGQLLNSLSREIGILGGLYIMHVER